MIPTPKSKLVIAAGATVASNATTSGSLDTLGYHYAVIDVCISTSATDSHTLSALVLSHNTSAATGGTALATGDTDFTIPTSDDTQPIARFGVDLRGRHRYLVLQMTSDTSANQYAIGHLYRADTVPDTASEAGVGVLHNI